MRAVLPRPVSRLGPYAARRHARDPPLPLRRIANGVGSKLIAELVKSTLESHPVSPRYLVSFIEDRGKTLHAVRELVFQPLIDYKNHPLLVMEIRAPHFSNDVLVYLESLFLFLFIVGADVYYRTVAVPHEARHPIREGRRRSLFFFRDHPLHLTLVEHLLDLSQDVLILAVRDEHARNLDIDFGRLGRGCCDRYGWARRSQEAS